MTQNGLFDIFSNVHVYTPSILHQKSPQGTVWKTTAQQGVWALKGVSLLERVRNS